MSVVDAREQIRRILFDADANDPHIVADEIIAVVKPLLHEEFMRGFQEGVQDAMGEDKEEH